jgi:hypothetical protein
MQSGSRQVTASLLVVGERNAGADAHPIASANGPENAAVRLESHIVADQAEARPCADVLVPTEFRPETGARHDRQVAARSAHDGDAGRTADHQTLAQIRRLTDIRAGKQQIGMPHDARQPLVVGPVEIVGDAVQKYAYEGRMKPCAARRIGMPRGQQQQ